MDSVRLVGELDGRVAMVSGDGMPGVSVALTAEGADVVPSVPSEGELDVVAHRVAVGGFDDSVFAPLELLQSVVPVLRRTAGGSIVLVSEPAVGADVMSTRALTVALQTLAAEVGPEGIRVNQIVPGPRSSTDLADVVLFFATARSRAITGQTLVMSSA